MNFKSQIQLDLVTANNLGGKFTDSDMLAAAYPSFGKPHEFGQMMTQLFASQSKFWKAKPLLGSTEAKGKVKFIDNEVYRWYIEGADDCAARSIGNRNAPDARLGLNGTEFEVVLSEKWFSPSEIITGEDEAYPLEVLDYLGYDNGHLYKVKLATDSNVEFPSHLLEDYKEFTKVYNINNLEFTRARGGQTYNGRSRMGSQIGTFGQEIMITDKAMREDNRVKTAKHDGDYLAIPFMKKDANGKNVKFTKFMMYQQAKMHEELEMSKEYALWLGQKYTSIDENGYTKRMGPGLRQQLADGWTHRYSGALTEKMLQDYLMDIFFARLTQEERKVRVMTGTGGSMMFHDLLASSASSILTVDSNYVKPTSNGPTSNNLQYGAQFTKYIGQEGIEVEVWYNPLYDSLKYSKRKHPFYKDRPIDSWRMTFLDFGNATVDGMPTDNIRMLKLKDYYGYGWEEGLVDITGQPIKGKVTNSNLAGVKFFVDDSAGINVVDPTRCGELILDFES